MDFVVVTAASPASRFSAPFHFPTTAYNTARRSGVETTHDTNQSTIRDRTRVVGFGATRRGNEA